MSVRLAGRDAPPADAWLTCESRVDIDRPHDQRAYELFNLSTFGFRMVRPLTSVPLASVLFGAAMVGMPLESWARTRLADPNTLQRVFAEATAGDVIALAPGRYVSVRLSGKRFSPAVTLDATKAQWISLSLRNVEGLTIRGGAFGLGDPIKHPRTGKPLFGQTLRMDDVRDIIVIGGRFAGPGGRQEGDPFGEGQGVLVTRGSGIRVLDGAFTGLASGVAMSKVDRFVISGNKFQYMRSDGVQVGEGRRGVIERNTCEATRIRSTEHADCIQLWSRPTTEPTADVIIRGNIAEGMTQGIGLFSKLGDKSNGGFDRITIENNRLKVGHPHGIALYEGRDSIVRNNSVSTFPGSRWRATINLVGGDTKRCGNSIAAAKGKDAEIDPPCKPD
jgi:hypothetical protein